MKYCAILVYVLLVFDLEADEQFARKVKPFLNTYCVTCHGPEKQKGKVRVDQLTDSPRKREDAELWSKILELSLIHI